MSKLVDFSQGYGAVELNQQNGLTPSGMHLNQYQSQTSMGFLHDLLSYGVALCMFLWPFPKWLWSLGHFQHLVQLQ